MHDMQTSGAVNALRPDAVEIERLIDWLLGEALGNTDPERLLAGTAERLVRAGIPLYRVQIGFRILHPLYHGFTVTWTSNGGAVQHGHLYTDGDRSPAWLTSPYYHMLSHGQNEMRRQLAGPEAAPDFPVLQEFAASGGTDYFAKVVSFANDPEAVVAGISDDGRPGTDGILMSWTSSRPEGFSDGEIAVLRRVQMRVAVAAKMHIRSQTVENVLNAYLGPHAGRRVLDGQIRRGTGEDITAVIWFCDLAGSTPLADSMPRAEFLELLNGFLEVITGAVVGRGGQVLRYIGDAVLAIFPVEGGNCAMASCGSEAAACRTALDAALDARHGVNRLNTARSEAGKPALGFSIGLHLGDITYGNIGSPERIEFTVIGAAANEAARIQAKCKELGVWCLASSTLWDACGGDERLVPKGSHALRGVGAPLELFSLV